jgi:hypothetical protein
MKFFHGVLFEAIDQQPHLLQAINYARPWHQVGIGDVRPVRNLVDAPTILADHGVANVGKLAVLKDEEVVLVSNILQLGSNAGIPPANNTSAIMSCTPNS